MSTGGEFALPHDPDAARRLDSGFDRAVGLLLVADLDQPARCGKRALGPLKVAEVGPDAQRLARRLRNNRPVRLARPG